MNYRNLDQDELIRAWTFCLMLKGEPGILQPVSLNLETQIMICEKADGNLAANPELVTNQNRDIFVEHLTKGISSLNKRGIFHLGITPSNIWINKDPPKLMIGGFEKCTMSRDMSNSSWQTSGVIICLCLLQGNDKYIEGTSENGDESEGSTEEDLSKMMKEIKEQLSQTVSMLVLDKEKRPEVLSNAFILFSTAMKNGQLNIEDAKKYIMFSLYVALNLSMVKIDYLTFPTDITKIDNMEWYSQFVSPLAGSSPRNH